MFGSKNELSTHLLTGWSKQTCKTHWHRIAESYLWTAHLSLCDPPLVEASFLKQLQMSIILGGKVPGVSVASLSPCDRLRRPRCHIHLGKRSLGYPTMVFPHHTNVSKYWVLEIQLVFNHLKEGFPWGGCERSTMVNATENHENKYLKIYHWRNLAHITSHLPISIYVSSHLNCSIPKPAKVWNQSKPNLASLTGGSATR